MAGSDERTNNWVVIMTAVLGLVPLAVCITTAWNVMTSWRSRPGLTNPPPAAGGGDTIDVVESTTHQTPINPLAPAAGGGETVDVESTTPSTHQTPINPPPPAFGGVEEEDEGAMMERVQPQFYMRAVQETDILFERIKLFRATYPHLFLAGYPSHFPGASGGGSSAAIRGGTEEAESSSASATTGLVHGHDS